MRYSIGIACLSLGLAGCTNPAEEAVKAQLIDGESAQFRDVKRCSGDTDVWTGEVNAKNRMGAFVGFEPFFFDGTSVAFLSDSRFETMMSACYAHLSDDPEAVAEEPRTNGATPEPSGRWVISHDTNPLDDSRTTVARLAAEEGRSRFDGPVQFMARCQSNTTEVFVVWHEYLGDDSRSVYNEYKNVEVRVGDEPVQTQRWDISTDKQATFAPSAIALLRSMVQTERLVLQTTPYNEAPMTAVFDLTGADEAIGAVAETCNWEL